MCGCLSRAPLVGTWPATQACALDWEWNRQPFDLQARTESTELCQPGQITSKTFDKLRRLTTGTLCGNILQS